MGFPLYVPKFLVFNVSSSLSRHECTKRSKTDVACCNVQRVSTMLQLVKVSLILNNYLLVPREIVIFIISVYPETSLRETSRYKGKKNVSQGASDYVLCYIAGMEFSVKL